MQRLAIRRISHRTAPSTNRTSEGGKAAGMRRLVRLLPSLREKVQSVCSNADVAVPSSIFIPVEACRQFIIESGLLPRLSQADNGELLRIMESCKLGDVESSRWVVDGLREYIYTEPFASAHAFAIRSSAINEDGKTDPRAGLYTTKTIPSILTPQSDSVALKATLKTVIEGMKVVWASFFTKSAQAYVGVEEIFTPGMGGMGVVIQPVVGASFNFNGRNYLAPHIAGQISSGGIFDASGASLHPVATLVFGHGAAAVSQKWNSSTVSLNGGKDHGLDYNNVPQTQAIAVDLSVNGGSDALRIITLDELGKEGLSRILAQDPGFGLGVGFKDVRQRKIILEPDGIPNDIIAPFEIVHMNRFLELGGREAVLAVHDTLVQDMGGGVDVELAIMADPTLTRFTLHLTQVRFDVDSDCSERVVIPDQKGMVESEAFIGHGVKPDITRVVLIHGGASADVSTLQNSAATEIPHLLKSINGRLEGTGAILIVPETKGGSDLRFSQLSSFSAMIEFGATMPPSQASHQTRVMKAKDIFHGCVGDEMGRFDIEALQARAADVEKVGENITIYTLGNPATIYANKNSEFGPVRMSVQL